MDGFDFERLEVFRLAVRAARLGDRLGQAIARTHLHVSDQLRRASFSIPLNIAEGGGEFRPKEKARFYRMAKRSATECAAIEVVLRAEGVLPQDAAKELRGLLLSIVRMLTRMIVELDKGRVPGTRTGREGGKSTGNDRRKKESGPPREARSPR